MRLSYRHAAGAAALALVLGTTSPAQAAGCQVKQSREWATIRLPLIPESPARAVPLSGTVDIKDGTVSRLDVNPRKPSHMLISNGTTVMRSTDGGCSWGRVFDIQAPTFDRPFLETHSVIHDVVWDPSPANHRFVYLLVGMPEHVLPWVTGSYQTQVYRSTDAGASWTAAGQMFTGRAPDLAISADGSRLYLSMTLGPVFAVQRLVYSSADRGTTWSLRSVPPVAATQEFDRLSMTVDPADPNTVWATDFTRVRRSTDGGVTWTEVPYDEHPDGGSIDVYRTSASKPARVIVRAPQGSTADPPWHQSGGKPLVYRSDDGGRVWRPYVCPKGIYRMTHGAGPNYVFFDAIGADAALYRLDTRSMTFTPVRTPPTLAVTSMGVVDLTAKPAMWSLGALVDPKTRAARYQVISVYRGKL